jgi:hypothetical protein
VTWTEAAMGAPNLRGIDKGDACSTERVIIQKTARSRHTNSGKPGSTQTQLKRV